MPLPCAVRRRLGYRPSKGEVRGHRRLTPNRRRSTGCYTRGMSTEVTQRELRNNSGEIMRGLDQGKTYIVTRNGVPVGELAPLRRHRFVSAEAAVAVFKSAPSVDLERLRRDLDDAASQDLNPRG